ncbi:tetratricopeptide repeat protein [Actinomadura kijaniata]|uniref:tetratricopeptide repeat protein n=1 Tax=Actinomadura kijaniata TaxID=46161 RepID=UPI003F1D3BF9
MDHFLNGRMDEVALVLDALGGLSPRCAWADALWSTNRRFVAQISVRVLCEAALQLLDHGAEPSPQTAWPCLRAVATRTDLGSEDLARLASVLRAFGWPEQSLALCDRADAASRTVLAEVARAGAWRVLGNLTEAVAAFDRALTLEPGNWSLHLDLTDLYATQGDTAAALATVEQGLRHAFDEPLLCAARAAHRARLTGAPEAFAELERLAPQLDPGYHDWLRQQATGAA